MKTLLGTKIGMTQILGDDGTLTPVTIIEASPATVTQVKTVESDGYDAVQFGFGEGKNLSKAVAGHVKKSGVSPKEIRETRDNLTGEEKIGDKITVKAFAIGDAVDAIGTSKGKGWAGTIKRHNFKRHRKSHGGKGNTRKVGSIGWMYPQKVMKGHPMAGQMGAERVTVKNLTVAYVDIAKNIIGVKGAVPGPKKSVVEISLAKKFNHGKSNGKETK